MSEPAIKSKSRFLKGLRITLLAFISVISLVCLLLFVVFGTQPGTQWFFNTLSDNFSPAKIEYRELQGNLLSRIQIHDLSYEDAELQFKVKTLTYAWQPQQLFSQVAYLELLELDRVRAELKNNNQQQNKSPDAMAETDRVLTDILLPISFIINKIKISDAQIKTAGNEEPLIINSVLVKAIAKESTIELLQFKIISPEIDFASEGNFKLNKNYPLTINTELQLKKENLPSVFSRGQIQGDFSLLNFTQSLSGDLQGKLDVKLFTPLNELSWNGVLNLQQIPLKLLNDFLPVEGNLPAEGSSLAEGSSQAQAEGSSLAEGSSQAQAECSSLAEGSSQAEGSIQAKVSTFSLSLNGEGNQDKANIKLLQIKLGEGEINLSGQLGWLDELTWDLAMDTQAINPGLVKSGLSGDINLKLNSKGKKNLNGDDNLEMQLTLQHLKGTLNGQVLSGEGNLLIQNDNIEIQSFKLASGQANIKLNGIIEQKMDLKWKVDIPNLEYLMPDMSGSLNGDGRLSGTQEKAVLEGNINSAQLFYEAKKVSQAKLIFSLSNDENYQGYLSLEIDNILWQEKVLRAINLDIKGSAKSQAINLKSNILANQLALKMRGVYDSGKKLWLGNISQLNVHSDDFGLWQQKENTHLLIQHDKAILEKLCLYDKKSSLCTSVHWQDEKTRADLQVKNILLSKAKPWLPEDVTELTGALNLDAKITIQDDVNVQANIELTPGVVSYKIEPDTPLRINYQKGSIKAVMDEQSAKAQWNLNLGEHYVQGNFEIPRKALEADISNAPIKGKIKLNLSELGFLTALVHEISAAKGFIQADLQLDGTLSAPMINGVAEFVSQQISIPDAGVKLSNVNLKIKGRMDEKMAITGQVNSGEGKLDINGMLSLDAKKNWPVSLHLKGEQFQLVNLPELQALISPDVELEHGIKGLKIKGVLEIPQANIYLNELPEGIKRVSDDVVVVGEEASKPANIDLNIIVKLGKNVHLKAFGLDAWLNGQMQIIKIPEQLPTANGELRTTHGKFFAYGQYLTLEQGRISYAGGYLDNPGLNIRASKEVQNITVGVMASGTADELKMGTYSSDPGLNSEDRVALLLTGQKLDNAANARIYAGTELTDELSVGVNAGAGEEGSEFVVRYRLRKNMHLEGVSSAKKSGGNLIYTIEIE